MTIAMTTTAAAAFPNRGPRRHSAAGPTDDGAAGGLAGRLSAWAGRRADRRRLRRELESLLQADDRILRDIGVSRYDLRRALFGL